MVFFIEFFLANVAGLSTTLAEDKAYRHGVSGKGLYSNLVSLAEYSTIIYKVVSMILQVLNAHNSIACLLSTEVLITRIRVGSLVVYSHTFTVY